MRDDSAELDLDEDQQELYAAVFAKTGEIKAEAFVRRTQNKPRPNRAKSAVKDTTGEMARKLAAIGYQPAKAVSRIQRDGKLEKRKNRVKTDFARERNELAALAEEHGLSFEEETRQKRMSNRAIRKSGAGARSGGTGRVLTSRPKHLFSGKRKLGKTNRR
ncbi:hypothetical protein MHBO_000087 [Bonamia ostreae]|uniref:Uncharacterized protein n=1 Tax=Bonamia ostreae TaxID=126728 RepID=A0ABV2AEB4_9EUKA